MTSDNSVSMRIAAAGLFSAALFVLAVKIGLGVVFLFLPTIPLFLYGLRTPSLAPTLLASVVVTALTGFDTGLFFLLVLGLPGYYLTRLWMRHRDTWFPVGLSLAHLSVWACVFLTALTLYHYVGDSLPLHIMLTNQINQAMVLLQSKMEVAIGALLPSMVFMVVGLSAWMWAGMLYVCGWVAHRLLVQQREALRESVAIEPFSLPVWTLQLLALAGLASLIGSPAIAFLGNSVLVIGLFPYFLLGLALLHHTSKAWPSRGFFLFFIYSLLLLFLWPAMIFAGIGLWQQIKDLSGAQS